jgi:hypothetical protein
VATEAARLKSKISYREEKEKTDLTLTGLLMEGLGGVNNKRTFALCRKQAKFE